MPRLTLRHSNNLIDNYDKIQLFKELHDYLIKTKHFGNINDIKSTIEEKWYYLGDGDLDNIFITLELKILSGRSDEVKRELSSGALEILKNHFQLSIRNRKANVTCFVSEIDKVGYSKI